MLRNPQRVGIVAALFIGAVFLAALTAGPAATPSVGQADKLFDQKQYKEAAEAYEALVEAGGDKWRHAAERRIMCLLRLNLFDDAVNTAQDYVTRCKGTPYEARAERLTGNLYAQLPHWGTRSGGQFYRGQRRQGIYLQSWRYDKRQAVAHMERARDLYAAFDEPDKLTDLPEDERKGWHAERIECIFDLASLVSMFTIYSDNAYYWHAWWGERDDFLAETAGEKDFDEGYSHSEWTRKRPIGLRVGPAGEPVWPSAPDDYAAGLGDDEKILYLLAEVRGLDETPEGKFTALSYYRQAMLARKRFGMDRLNGYSNAYYVSGRYPLKQQLEKFNPWEMTDGQALVLAGGKIRVVELPPQFDVLALLRTVSGDYARSGIADQARYGTGLYYQTRQQYNRALAEYEALLELFEEGQWPARAADQIQKIKAPQVRISDSGVQLPGTPATVQLSYRNMDQVWFVARRIDARAFLEELRAETANVNSKVYWWYINGLRNWHQAYTWDRNALRNDYNKFLAGIAAKHLGAEVARWSAGLKDDGSHRYAQATLEAPVKERGGYLIYAYKAAPPQAPLKSGMDGIFVGDSRAVFVLADLAIVEKVTSKGKLYLIADAVSGAPVRGAQIQVLELWNEYDRAKRQTIYRRQVTDLKANADGMAVYPSPVGRGLGTLHVLVKAPGDRLAWTGMNWWGRYSPSRMRDGWFAYAVTDRPVYRPEQTVHVKAWIRRMVRGEYQSPAGTSFRITVTDARGNKIHEVTKQADEFGGLDTDVVLGAEPPLGSYRISIARGKQGVGGQRFRVEEYKKPEFEVTVEPDRSHAKLGESVTALIKAGYYFGAPVTAATVKYRVFREEYTHAYYPPGEWDWLYGQGYGYGWYDYDWFPWWGWVRCCRMPPPWWGPPRSRVRELVMQGEAPIGEDGTLKVEIDSAPALKDHPDRDHRYVVQAEVTDSSRRTITGEGAVKVTRQAFYASVHTDRGYYRPGEEMVVTVRCLTPGNRPVEAEGVVTISSVVFGGPDNARIDETELERFTAKCDERGRLSFRRRWEKSGQLKIRFVAPDEWGGQVEGYGLVWVVGRDFDGRLHRFNDLEMVTDKRTYQPGEVAHVMLNTKRKGSYVLFGDEVDNGALLGYRLLHLPEGHAVVDVRVKKGDRPNFFVEATTVSDARVHQQSRRICVPPEEGVVKLTVEADKAEYGPGDEARVKLTALTLEGEPVDVQVALTAFDKSVLYIQPEFAAPIAKFFHGRLRYHAVNMMTNLLERFAAMGYVRRPFQDLGSLPPGWHGIWGPTVEGWSYITDQELRSLGGGAGLGRSRRALAAEGVMEEKAASFFGMAGAPAADADKADGMAPPAPGEAALVEPQVRKAFADTALWLASVVTGADGVATCTFNMPDNLTTWKLKAWGISKATRVGEADTEAVTTKNLLVRLQAPRFFMEHDEVVLSANVHNYLAGPKAARVKLELPEGVLALMDGSPAELEVRVPADGEKRVDWRLKVLNEGSATIKVSALTDEESDAMEMTFPVLVHGMLKQDSYTGSARPEEQLAVRTVEFVVPDKRRPELTQLKVQFAPSLVGAMMDALPYCLDYPYRSSDATINRFLPAVLTLKTLRNMGIELEDVKDIRGRLAEVQRREKDRRVRSWYAMHPIFDSDELYGVIDRALKLLRKMQQGDGGWSWWERGSSSPYFTAYVLNGLVAAKDAGVGVDDAVIQRGMNWLRNWDIQRMRQKNWQPSATYAFHAYVLSAGGIRVKDQQAGDLLDRLFEGRDKLGLYGKALLAMAMANVDDGARARIVLRNIMQYLEENEETEIAWFRTPQQGWWYWWNNDIETNAWCLRAIVRIEPKSPVAPKLVKWLLENRRNGYYWRSPRDTTSCVAAMSDFAVASGETDPDYTLTLNLDDGAVVKKVKINKESFFTYDNSFVVEGVALGAGKHTLTITKEGPGALYYSAYLRYFTKEEHISSAGLQLKVDRTYYLLRQIPFEVEVEGSEGQKLTERRLRYERVPLNDGDRVGSGDLIQVELRIKSDNDYTYLVFEDMKPAGCEPTQLRSGGKGQEGFWSYMELRDEKVVFFVDNIGRGEHLMRHRLRAEIPGVFHALPAVVQGMYVPELRGNSNEHVLQIEDR